MPHWLFVLGCVLWLATGIVCAIICIVKVREAMEWREYEKLRAKRKRRPF